MSVNDEHSVSRYEPPQPPSGEGPRDYPREPAFEEPFEDEGGGGIDWSRYWAAVVRYKWIVALAFLLGAGGAYVTWGLVQPSYVAQGSLWVAGQGEGEQGPIATGRLLQSASWIELLRSFTVLDSVVREEKLYLRPGNPDDLPLFEQFELDSRFTPGSYTLVAGEDGRSAELRRDDAVVDQASAGEPIGASLGFDWTVPASGLPAGREIPFSVVTPRDAALQLRESLVTDMDPEGNFLRVELRGPNPQRITRVLDGIMERHVEVAASLKSGNLRERREALEDQLSDVENELRTAERNLEEFRVQTITLPSERSTPIQPGLEITRDPVFSNYFEMQVDVETLRREQERLRDVLDRAREGDVSLEVLELIPATQSSGDLQQAIANLRSARAERRTLLQSYTTEHPEVQAVSETVRELEQEVIPTLLRDLIQGLEAEEEVLAGRIDSAGSDLSEIPPRAIEEARLRRRVAMAEQLYQNVRSRYETTNLAEASTIPDVRILDRPTVPEVPSDDERIRYAGVVFAGILGLGILLTLLIDHFDPRVRYPDEIEERFGLPFLGVIPNVGNGKGSKPHGSREAYEAFRDLRTNLTYAYGTADPLIVTVSSPGQGDGKSLVSLNLAMAFAHQGKSTLLIDGDTRRGHLHRTLEVVRKPGLTDLLAAGGHANGIAKETGRQNLRLIPCGSRLSDAPELLGSSRLPDMLATFKRDYDVIVIDTPPLAAGSDAAILSCVAGHLVLVLRSGSTNKDFTKAKLEPLHRLPVRVLGVVLNDYSPGGAGPYTYYGNYLPGYETGDETATGKVGAEDGRRRRVSTGSGQGVG